MGLGFMKKMIFSCILILVVTASIFSYHFLTIFVVPKIGAVPDGVTIIMWRTEEMKFIDSAESICFRKRETSKFCMLGVFVSVVNSEDEIIIMKLPHVQFLEDIASYNKVI